MGAVKRNKIDIVFSNLVRGRVGYVCEYSGQEYPDPSTRQGLHCSHLYSRRHAATRWLPSNAFAHGFSAHQYLGGNPVIFAEWARQKLGAEEFERVRELHATTVKLTKADKADLYQHLKSEWDRMQQMRADGVTGRIEFTNPLFD